MTCPKCGRKTTVTESRLANDQGEEVRVRRRRCKYCGKTFFTIEYEIEDSQGLDLISQYWRVDK